MPRETPSDHRHNLRSFKFVDKKIRLYALARSQRRKTFRMLRVFACEDGRPSTSLLLLVDNLAAQDTMNGPWNLGLKVQDIDAELRFLKCCGATGIETGVISSADGDETFGMAYLGAQRLLLFPKIIYENPAQPPLEGGLRHAVFQVDSLDATLGQFAGEGVAPFWGPQEVSTPFGRRRIAFFRSPSGFVFETFEHLAEADPRP